MSFFRWKAMELALQHQMSVLTMWLWTSNGHKPLRAPGRPGAMAANPQRQKPPPRDRSDPVDPTTNPPSKPSNCRAFYTSVDSGLCFGTAQLSSSTSTRSLVWKSQWSVKATQLSLVYTDVRPRREHCVKLCGARNKLYAVWKQVEWLD